MGNLKYILISDRRQTERATYYMLPTVWHSSKSRTMESVKIWVVFSDWEQGGRREWGELRAQGIFRAMKLFCIILAWWIPDTYLSKHIDFKTHRLKSNINDGLYLITIY